MANNLEVTTAQLFAKATEYEDTGIMRRFVGIFVTVRLALSQMAWSYGMFQDNEIDEVGFRLAHFRR